MLLSTAIDEFLVVHTRGLSPHTQRGYTWQLDRFLAYCQSAGTLDTEQLRATTIASHIDALRTHPNRHGRAMSKGALRAYAKNLKVFLDWLVNEGEAPAKVLRFDIPRGERDIPNTLTSDQRSNWCEPAGSLRGVPFRRGTLPSCCS